MAEPKQQPPYPLRMPEELRIHLEGLAAGARRSLNAQLVEMLQEHPRLAEAVSELEAALARERAWKHHLPRKTLEALEAAATAAGRTITEEVVLRLNGSLSTAIELAPDLRQRIADVAEKSGRSVDAEAAYRLERTLSEDPIVGGASLAELFRVMEKMRRLIESGEFKPFDKAAIPVPAMKAVARADGALTIDGDTEALRRYLALHGVTRTLPRKEGVAVAVSQKEAALEVLKLRNVPVEWEPIRTTGPVDPQPRSSEGPAQAATPITAAETWPDGQMLVHGDTGALEEFFGAHGIQVEPHESGAIVPLESRNTALDVVRALGIRVTRRARPARR